MVSSVTRPGSVLNEIARGNADLESFSFPAFYLGCRRRFRTMQPEDIARYQRQRARNVVRYAARHAPFFTKLYRGCDLDDVWSLPPVDKAAMMANLTDYNTIGLAGQQILDFCAHVEATRDFSLRLKGVNVGMSSGTSGNKSVEITTPREERYLRAAFFARFPFPPTKVNMAFILRVTTPAFQFKLFGHRLTYISQLNTVEDIRAQLERLEPNVLAAPPSMLRILAREVKGGRLKLSPSELVAYAEVLYPEDRAVLQEVFGCPVYEIYKATEGSIAISCRHGSLHLNEDLIAVQLLNGDGTPTSPGTPSHRMLVTDLHKTSQPVVRYALNDVVTLSPRRCPCGSHFRMIEQIQGRADDVFWGHREEGESLQFVFPDYIRRAIITVSDQIEEYQVVQTSPEGVIVRLLVADANTQEPIAEDVQEAIQEVFRAYGCRAPQVEVSYEPPAPNVRSSKLVRIQRAFEIE